jgi:hypothetical protein
MYFTDSARHYLNSMRIWHGLQIRASYHYAITPLCPAVAAFVRLWLAKHYAVIPLRHYAVMPLRRYAFTQLRLYAITPLRNYAITPLRRYAFTPFIISPKNQTSPSP